MKMLTTNDRLVRMATAMMTILMIGFSSFFYAATAQAASTNAPFDHTKTGFILQDVHKILKCEQCHVDAIFKNTPKDCAGCHTTGTRVGATPKPLNHVATTSACNTCHFSAANFLVKSFNHMSVTGNCSTCHNSQSLGVLSKPATHFPTLLPCETCHKNTSTFLSWKMDHTGITSDCYACHGGPTPGSKVFPNTVSYNAAMHIPLGSAPPDCSACHTNFTSFLGVVYNHSITTFTCASCHSGQFVDVKVNVPPIPAKHITIPAGQDCNACHFNTTSFLGALYNHAGVVTGTCDTCHTGAYPGVMTTGASHIPRQSYKCDACHTAINTSGYTTFFGSVFHSAVTATAGSCATCHNGSYSAAPELAQGANAVSAHIPISSAQTCDLCHTASNTSLFTTFLGTLYHSSVTAPAGSCSTCHNGAYTSWNAQAVGTTHIPVAGAACDVCHTATNTAQFTTFSGAIYHTSVTATAGSCATCHNGSYAAAPELAQAAGASHIPVAGATCDVCHTASSTTLFTSFAGAKYHASVTATPGSCATCHNGSYAAAPELAQGANAVSTHIPVGGATCDVCHTAANTSLNTTFLGALYHSSVTATPGSCATCHTGGTYVTLPNSPLPVGATHIPVSGANCDVCHTAANTAGFTTFLGALYHASVSATLGTCSTCHGTTFYKPEGALSQADALTLSGVAHPTTSASCDTCHTSATTANYTTFLGAVFDHTVVAPPVAGRCSTCHNGVAAKGQSATHLVTALQCDSAGCHTPLTTSNYTTFLGGTVHPLTAITPGTCGTIGGCHSATVAPGLGVAAQGLPTTHPPTGSVTQCDSANGCHSTATTTYVSWAGTMYHPKGAAAGSCGTANCHTGTLWGTALAMSAGTHPPTGTVPATQCDSANGCHSSVAPGYASWAGTMYHPAGAAAGTCGTANCHTGTLWGTAITTPANHPPTGGLTCDSASGCHSTVAPSYAAWNGTMFHPAGAAAGTCGTANCHTGTLWGTAITTPANHPPTGGLTCDSASGCHSTVAPSYAAWNGTMYHPKGAAAGTCGTANCHTGTLWGTAITTPANHPPMGAVPATQCDSASGCHSTVAPSYTVWSGTMYHPAGAAAGTCGTTNCHSPNPGGTLGAVGEIAGHVATTGINCDACHTVTNTATYTTWLGASYAHTAASYGVCDTCHNGTQANGKLSPHIPATGTCDASGCHTAATTTAATNVALGYPAAWLGATYSPHPSTAAGTCTTCHSGAYPGVSTQSFNPGGLAGLNGQAHTVTTAQCDTCHTAAISGYLTATATWAGAGFAHTATSAPAGSCINSGCHGPGGAGKGVSANHIITPSVPSCDSGGCHKVFGGTVTTFAGGIMNHSVAPYATLRCDSCHNGSFTTFGTFGAVAKVSNHIPTTMSAAVASSTGAGDCNVCHTAAAPTVAATAGSTAWVTETVGVTQHGGFNGGGSGGIYCVTCHLSSASYLASKIQKVSHNGASMTKDCSVSGCHKPLGSKGTSWSKWN